jgi:short subunit fatty acids transporter
MRAEHPRTADEALAVARTHRTLEDVVRWGLGLAPPVMIADVVVQDEYTHDVVVPVAAAYLVYDTT